jgi:hypothetical protein
VRSIYTDCKSKFGVAKSFELRIQVQCEPERAMLRAFGVYIVRGSAVELGVLVTKNTDDVDARGALKFGACGFR